MPSGPSPPPTAAVLTVGAIATAWGVIGLIVREVDLPAVAIVAARCWLGATGVGIGLALHHHRTRSPRPRPQRPLLTGAVGVGLAIHWLLLVAAQQRAPLGTVMLVMYLSPVLVALLAPRVLGETVAPSTKLALVLAACGLALLARPERGAVGGFLLAVAAGVSFAVLTLLAKSVVADVGGFWLAFSNLGIAGLVLAPFALTAAWGPPQASWLWLLVLGLVLTAVLGPLYLVSLNRLPASTTGVLLYLEPVSALVLAWLVLGEDPSVLTLAGGALIVTGGIIVIRQSTFTAEGEVMAHVPG